VIERPLAQELQGVGERIDRREVLLAVGRLVVVAVAVEHHVPQRRQGEDRELAARRGVAGQGLPQVGLRRSSCAQAGGPPQTGGFVEFAFRRQVDELLTENGAVVGVRGSVLEPDESERGESSRTVVREFEHQAAVAVTSGVPAHVDGRMLADPKSAGERVVNRDRLWAYTEGIINWDPAWPNHGIRILPARRRCGSTRTAAA
jgi:hypothetical protein